MPDRDFFSRPQDALSLSFDPDSVMTPAQSAEDHTNNPSVSKTFTLEEAIAICRSGFAPSENALAPPIITPMAGSAPTTPTASTPMTLPTMLTMPASSTAPNIPMIPNMPTVPNECTDCRGLCLSDPYPTARAVAPNDRYGRMIRSSYSGRESALSCMMNLLYHALRFSECSEDVKTTLFDIAICKLHHLKLLGELLCTLGGDPKFFYFTAPTGNTTSWWAANPATLTYAKNLGEALKADIAAEKNAIEEHYNAINYIDDNGVTTLLKRIVQDEEFHLKILTELYQRFCS